MPVRGVGAVAGELSDKLPEQIDQSSGRELREGFAGVGALTRVGVEAMPDALKKGEEHEPSHA